MDVRGVRHIEEILHAMESIRLDFPFSQCGLNGIYIGAADLVGQGCFVYFNQFVTRRNNGSAGQTSHCNFRLTQSCCRCHLCRANFAASGND